VLAGLIMPPTVVPTIWVLQRLGLFRTMPGLILVEVAFGMSFCILLFRGLHLQHPQGVGRGGHHRRRRLGPGCSFRVIFRCCARS
jgi:hypothetical protein